MTLKTKLAILVVSAMLIGFAAHGEGMGKAEVRALLEDVLATEYCGTAIAEGLGVTTAIQGLSPVMGRGFVKLEEADWGPVLLEMAAEELDRCIETTGETVTEYRKAEESRGDVYASKVAIYGEVAKLRRMLSLMIKMEGEHATVLQMLGRIARESPIEFNIYHSANHAWIEQTMKDGEVVDCLELARWYRRKNGKGSIEELDFCLQIASDALPKCTTEKEYALMARYVLEAMDGCGNYPQCHGFDHAATDHLRGWVGSLQRRRMAERFLDRQPFRRSHVNEETGAVEYEPPTQEEVANLLRTLAAAELAADEKELTDLREVYGE